MHGGIFDEPNKRFRLDELNAQSEDPSFWNDGVKAQGLMRERTSIETDLKQIDEIQAIFDDLETMIEFEDDEMADEAKGLVAQAEAIFDKLEFKRMLGEPEDALNAYVDIHAGAGGTESQDWAEMLLRMYLRWGDKKGFKTDLIEVSAGEEAGIKSATIHIQGEYAFGYLKSETGIHRLVRISPFDSQARRHTSFSSVYVYPEVDENIEIEILDKDLRIDTYRASGAGGQHVNKTDSAVRITHMPTNIVVACQTERSQHQNRDTAFKMLRARLYEHELEKRREKEAEAEANKSDIGWGHQIRSYVLHPYQMVKDLRTGVEKGNAQGVLDGDLDDYMEAALKWKAGAKRVE
ncbi:MAG: peptide chain release factor 2 [Proteobacteria bacterium CG1_02_64_396]|nr:MAG: peptide chain release factor 2 [Proteobacteria bacterium CG1_02_64_396]